MDQWMTWIPEIGFPVVLSFYLLHRMEGKLDMLISSIHSLAGNIKG
ncbi:YvrJ family protein [Pontibacillus yanchengensis]|uniref:YvrJ family protein n=2 Tax=Pontibacillus yanchengensis TaxID=462910 RepID=A0ACC7VBF2_9BACI|nr:YvrJ family protein [Pontibacillus yanchengensis]MYL34791.1 YvrJ family protein [Pontibacillus yanchengensis]MYL52223.1 YvrJ family protein [Pontibacillus yanchengensis]